MPRAYPTSHSSFVGQSCPTCVSTGCGTAVAERPYPRAPYPTSVRTAWASSYAQRGHGPGSFGCASGPLRARAGTTCPAASSTCAGWYHARRVSTAQEGTEIVPDTRQYCAGSGRRVSRPGSAIRTGARRGRGGVGVDSPSKCSSWYEPYAFPRAAAHLFVDARSHCLVAFPRVFPQIQIQRLRRCHSLRGPPRAVSPEHAVSIHTTPETAPAKSKHFAVQRVRKRSRSWLFTWRPSSVSSRQRLSCAFCFASLWLKFCALLQPSDNPTIRPASTARFCSRSAHPSAFTSPCLAGCAIFASNAARMASLSPYPASGALSGPRSGRRPCLYVTCCLAVNGWSRPDASAASTAMLGAGAEMARRLSLSEC
eukprot:1420070-Rhodomonas_salina.3